MELHFLIHVLEVCHLIDMTSERIMYVDCLDRAREYMYFLNLLENSILMQRHSRLFIPGLITQPIVYFHAEVFNCCLRKKFLREIIVPFEFRCLLLDLIILFFNSFFSGFYLGIPRLDYVFKSTLLCPNYIVSTSLRHNKRWVSS
jgi:hypothetical protein